MADGDGDGGGASPAREGGDGGAWVRVYDRMRAILVKTHRDVERLLADRTRLEGLLQIQHDFWLRHHAVLSDGLDETRRVDDCVQRGDAAMLHQLQDEKDLELRRHRDYIAALTEENNQLKIKLKEAESCAELSEPSTDPERSGRDLKSELRKLKKAYKALSSQKETEVSALLAEKDFVWNQFKMMEKDYKALVKKMDKEAAQATEAAEKLQQKLEELQLQVVAQKKDDDIGRLQAEANDAKMKMLALEDKLHKMHSLVSEKDDEIQKLKSGHLQASQKQKDINGARRKCRSEGPSVRGKSKGNPRRQIVEEDQPETSQKRQCPSSLSVRGKSKGNPRRQIVEEDQPETSQKRQCPSSLSSGVALGGRPLHKTHRKPVPSASQQHVLFSANFKTSAMPVFRWCVELAMRSAVRPLRCRCLGGVWS
ncbi:axoneme-associated protein mst101(2)-like isoform X1 [Hordeum vulgare subsp. vulgare]|uniref:axoneme-associated protein mst101(2)-like isoform X1 n=1 Tax=Hordeum vulgare subsp. vulgare TaxID=112509 RepID=UPI001D1A35BB|nr:axoneme-associated protein mst101(2)-like isoform X1 [Hordeum vulgare subsp. vulgare]